MAVFRSPREMEVEDLNIDEDPTMDVQTETPDQALEKTPKSGMIDPVMLLYPQVKRCITFKHLSMYVFM